MKKLFCVSSMLLLMSSVPVMASEDLSLGQTLYLPVYSKIWHGDRVIQGKYPIDSLLSALISIRNTSLKTPIRVTSARYFSTEGKFLKEFIVKPEVINSVGTFELFVERKETEGGSGASFVIQWESSAPTNPPIVEAIHADIRSGQQAMIFTTSAQAIRADK